MNGLRKALNIVGNGLRPSFLPVMLGKVKTRFTERNLHSVEANMAWCASVADDADAWAQALDADLWVEAQSYAEDHATYAPKVLEPIGIDLGGGGHYALLYFLARYLKPDVVLETGVAAGHSSRAILSALDKNGTGQLFSSDFPYFRLHDPVRFIGVLVEDHLKAGWTLRTKGDEANLLELLALAEGEVGLFHYDSDKSNAGRDAALALVTPRLAANAIIMFDDIQDTDHFQRLTETHPGSWKVFPFNGKYVGLLIPFACTSSQNT